MANHSAAASDASVDDGAMDSPAARPQSAQVVQPHCNRHGIPGYLYRSYWWAYLSPAAVRLFDCQPVINAILFGRYRALLRACLDLLEPAATGSTLQIAAVYGILTERLARQLPDGALHLVDVAPIQLATIRRKLERRGKAIHLYQANAESLPYRSGSFQTVLLFFLLHELPTAARGQVLREALRVLAPSGALIVADYGELTIRHPMHALVPVRRVLERVEPFLGDFWRHDLCRQVGAQAQSVHRAVRLEACRKIFGGFYQVSRYRVEADRSPPLP